MPIYEYHCRKCGNFEAMQKMSDKPLVHCPTCRRRVTKLISATSFQLKGSGWYVTDYARKGDGKPDDQREQKGEGKGEGKKDAEKPASSPASSAETTPSSDKPATEKPRGAKKSSEKTAAA